MKAISLWQPWALLWLLSDPDEKVFETRHWYTSYRGPLLVHAGKRRDREILGAINDDDIAEALIRHGIYEGAAMLNFGSLIGQIDLIGCSRMDRMAAPSVRERSFGHWQPDRFAWERGPKPVIFPKAIPYRGAQGFFDVPDDLITPQAVSV